MTTRFKSEQNIIGLLQRRLDDLERSINNSFLPEPWREVGTANNPAFENSWVNYDAAAYPKAGFRKEPGGTVRLHGLVKNGTIGQNIFTLPIGYWPFRAELFSAIAGDASARLEIFVNGQVRIVVGSNVYASLNCSFVIA